MAQKSFWPELPAGIRGRQVAHLANGQPANVQFLCFFMAYKKAITTLTGNGNPTPRLPPSIYFLESLQVLLHPDKVAVSAKVYHFLTVKHD